MDEEKEGAMEKQNNVWSDEKETWCWFRNADLKVETEAMLFAAQEQAIRTHHVKHKIDETAQSPLCRMCDKKSETISHIVSECEKLAQKEYKRRYENVARIVHWKLCGKYNQCDRQIKARKPDIVLLNKNGRSCTIIDIAIPEDMS